MMALEPGHLFGGRYRIIKALGAGGMGAVYLACDPRYDNFYVALKVLYPGLIRTDEARERFRSELLACYRVNHRNVVRAYEYFDQEDQQALAMEYVDGTDLLDQINNEVITYPEIIRILKETAAGLGAIHAEGIVHRDLKPENIMLNSRREVKITDFGVARLKGMISLSKSGSMVGTPKYLAPEYIETGECDHRGDLYALGIIAYELVAGRSPFKSTTGVSLMVERLRTEVDPLAIIAPDCPADLRQVIERLMSVNVNRRYQTAEEVVLDLEKIERNEPLELVWCEDEIEEIEDKLQSESILKEIKQRELVDEDDLLDPRPATSFNWLRSLFLLAAIVTVLSLYKLGYFAPGGTGLMRLKAGNYSGSVKGVLGADRENVFRLWRTEAGTYALLAEPYCKVSRVSPANRFYCGDLIFEVRVAEFDDNEATGTIRELTFDTRGQWTLKKVGVNK